MIRSKFFDSVGIVGFGAYVPRFRLKVSEVAEVWGKEGKEIESSLGVRQKAVADLDEDCVTMGVEAGRIAIERAGIKPQKIGAVFVGSESHPYAVNPSGTVVAKALGVGREYFCVDLTFACKAGTAGMQIVAAMIEAGMIDYGLVVGSDKAQGRPGDVLDFTAGAGAAAFVLGRKKKEFLARLRATYSFSSDTTDFWRRQGEKYPSHAGRFTGEPGYFYHVESCSKNFLKTIKMKPRDFDYAVFHMPNAKFPRKVAASLGFRPDQLETGWLVEEIGNSYASSSLLGLCLVLEKALGEQTIFMTSYGSGAGSDSFYFKTTELLKKKIKGNLLREKFRDTQKISYGQYLRKIEAI
jgi:hydroxymethylglutaryl-CoA synthase